LSPADHTAIAAILRDKAKSEDLAGHLAEERGDNISAADHLDLRELFHRAADHHTAVAAYAASITATPGDDAITS